MSSAVDIQSSTPGGRMDPQTLYVAIVGAGAISRNHLEAYRALDGVEVVGVCDTDQDRAQSVADEHSIPGAYTSVSDLLAWRETASGRGLDIVSVCTPHPAHEDVVVQTAQAGVHVLCEKPIAIDLVAADRMTTACRNAGVKFGVLFQRRFWPAAQQLRAAIDDGSLGDPMLGHCSVLLQRDSEYYSANPWRGSWATDGGGVLMTQGIHYIDLLQWYMGTVTEVHGYMDTFVHAEGMETEDTAVATIKFSNGAMATLQASTAVAPSLGAQIRFTGTSGATAQLTEFPEGTDGRLDVWASGDVIESSATWPAEAKANVDLATINAALLPWHKRQVAQFVDAVRTDAAPAVTGEDATESLRILLAVYKSSRTGRVVTL